MNRHTKLAITIAPFLAIGGYIAAGYYQDSVVAEQSLVVQLALKHPCNLTSTECILEAQGLNIRVSKVEGKPQVITNYPLQSVAIAFVDHDNREQPFIMSPDKDGLTWHSDSSDSNQSLHKVRLAATVKNLTFLHEFEPGQ